MEPKQYRDWVDELVSLRIENAELQEQLDDCLQEQAFERAVERARAEMRYRAQQASQNAPAPTTALARRAPASVGRLSEPHTRRQEEPVYRDFSSIWGEPDRNPPPVSPKQDPLDELVSLRLNNKRLRHALSFHQRDHGSGDLMAGVSSSGYAAPSPSPSPNQQQVAGLLGPAREPAQLPPATRRLGPKREGVE